MDAQVILEIGEQAKILNPDWIQIQKALSQMDGHIIHEVSLDVKDKGGLLANGGNNGRYLVVYFPEDPIADPSLTLTDISLTGPEVTLTVQTLSEYPVRWCVRLPLVLKVFEHFFRTGEVPQDVRWEIDTTGTEKK